MTRVQKSVGHAFERALKDVYGHSLFAVDETGSQSGFRVREDPDHFLKLATFFTRELNTTRPGDALGDRWAGQFFVMRQISGQIRLRFDNDAPVMLRAGDVLLMNPYSQCEYQSQRANEVALIALPFDSVGGEDAVLAACGGRVTTQSAAGAVLCTALGALLGRAKPGDVEDRQMMNQVIRNLLARVVATTPAAADVPATADGLMRRAHSFALNYLADPDLSPDAIAVGVGVSRRHLYRAFSEHGQTPANWIWALRTEQAHLRLTSPEQHKKSLTELAFAVGFNDMAHFSRVYRGRYGCSPRQARLAALSGEPAGTVSQSDLAR
jgi:AraC-like DNA-binding protein